MTHVHQRISAVRVNASIATHGCQSPIHAGLNLYLSCWDHCEAVNCTVPYSILDASAFVDEYVHSNTSAPSYRYKSSHCAIKSPAPAQFTSKEIHCTSTSSFCAVIVDAPNSSRIPVQAITL